MSTSPAIPANLIACQSLADFCSSLPDELFSDEGLIKFYKRLPTELKEGFKPILASLSPAIAPHLGEDSLALKTAPGLPETPSFPAPSAADQPRSESSRTSGFE